MNSLWTQFTQALAQNSKTFETFRGLTGDDRIVELIKKYGFTDIEEIAEIMTEFKNQQAPPPSINQAPPNQAPIQPTMSSDSTEKKELKSTKSLPRDIDGFKFLMKLQFSRSAIWKVRKENRILLLKTADMYNQRDIVNDLKNEVFIYQKLEQYQGKYLPKLFYHGILGGLMFFLALTYINAPNLANSAPFSRDMYDRMKKKASRILTRIHSLGILHNDIRPENIIVWQTKNNHLGVFFIDFEFAKVEIPNNSTKFETEKQDLKLMFQEMEKNLVKSEEEFIQKKEEEKV